MVAKIAVAAANFAIDKPYSYWVPEGMALQPGVRVSVPFGRGNRRSEGVVLELTGHADENAYFSYLCEMRREIPALRYENCRTADGTTHTQIPAELKALVDKLKNWSYYKLKFKR